MPISSMTPRSPPEILSPTGVRIPVVSMSILPLIGMVHAFATPGTFSASFIWLMRSSREMLIRRDATEDRLSPIPAPTRNTMSHPAPLRLRFKGDHGFEHGERRRVCRGLSSARLAEHGSTSGKRLMIRSVPWSSFWASAMEMPGMVVGM